MNNYYTKYLKYKNKYIELKNDINQIGGKKIRKTKFTKIINNLLGGGKIEDTLEKIFHTFNSDSDGDSLQDNANSLQEIFVAKKISPCHGIEHAKQVM